MEIDGGFLMQLANSIYARVETDFDIESPESKESIRKFLDIVTNLIEQGDANGAVAAIILMQERYLSERYSDNYNEGIRRKLFKMGQSNRAKTKVKVIEHESMQEKYNRAADRLTQNGANIDEVHRDILGELGLTLEQGRDKKRTWKTRRNR